MTLRDQLNEDERNTVLAALRWYQHSGMGNPVNRPVWLQDIVCSPAGTWLCDNGIDALCERLNRSGEVDHGSD